MSAVEWYFAASAIGEIGSWRAIDPIMLALKEVNVNVREAAKEALELIDAVR